MFPLVEVIVAIPLPPKVTGLKNSISPEVD
jgi:hypothetical protein